MKHVKRVSDESADKTIKKSWEGEAGTASQSTEEKIEREREGKER